MGGCGGVRGRLWRVVLVVSVDEVPAVRRREVAGRREGPCAAEELPALPGVGIGAPLGRDCDQDGEAVTLLVLPPSRRERAVEYWLARRVVVRRTQLAHRHTRECRAAYGDLGGCRGCRELGPRRFGDHW